MLTTAKTVFVISLLTTKMIMPGMPQMPAGMKIPGMGEPTKTMTMDLTSDKKVDASSKAQCAVPDGLKLGPKVDLEIDLPVKEEITPGTAGPTGKPGEMPKFEMKTYWKCSDTVLPGQPKILDSETMMKSIPPGTMSRMPGMGAMHGGMRARVMASTADRSLAYWPNSIDKKKIVPESSSPGDYALTTNYCGATSITFDPEQEFLAPIELTSPGKSVDLAKAISIAWKSVPNAQAYIITAFAGKQGEMVMWTSSSQPETSVDYMGKALTKAEVKGYIDKGIFLPADATQCSIPAGIFQGMSMPMISMTAIGVDKLQDKNGIQTNVVVRSTGNLMLGMGGMGMMGAPPADSSTTSDQPATVITPAASTDSSSSTAPAPQPDNSPTGKAKDALHKLGHIFGH